MTCKVYAVDYEEFTSEQEFEYIVGQELQFPPFLPEAGIILAIIFLLFVGSALAGR